MKITIYELLGLIKDDKAPKKIKIDESTLFLSKIDGIRYRFEKCGSLNWDYYIETDRLDAPVEILDKDFKLEEEQDINVLELQENISKLQSEIDLLSNEIGSYHNKIHSMRDRNNYMKEQLKELIKAVNELKNKE